MPSKSQKAVLGVAAGIALTVLGLVLLRNSPAAQIPAFLLLWVWPAISMILMFDGPFIERLLISSGLSYLLVALLMLLAGYLSGPSSPWIVLAGLLAITAAILLAIWRRGSVAAIEFRGSTLHWSSIALIVVLALLLRLSNLGYKEFQGDEGIIMTRAASLLTGDEAEIFLHQKGPVEILVPAATWAITGTIDDYWSRLPFTWAGVLEVVAIYWLARLWFGRRAGLVAGLLFALSGFGIAFSRIIQYQSLVMLWGTVALVTATRYRESGRSRYLWLTAALIGGGLLAHYDAVLVIPAIVWVLCGRLCKPGKFRLGAVVTTIGIVLIIAGLFYVPFLLNPNASRTIDYILGDRVTVSEGASVFGWSGSAVWRMITFYDSIWYVLGILLMGSIGLIRSLYKRKEVAAVVYFLVPALFYLIIVGDPRTHVYTMVPGALMLTSFGAIEIWRSVGRSGNRFLKTAAIGVSILWLVIVIIYPYLMFVDIKVERQRTWTENRPLPNLYPATWDEPPLYGLFGFPHQAGWRAALDVVPSGGYPYASNEEEEITNWYMSQRARTHCADAKTVLIATDTQDEVFLDPEWFVDYTLQGQIFVGNEPTLKIYGREAVDDAGVVDSSGSQRWLKPEDVAPPKLSGDFSASYTLDDQVRLIGYDLDTSNAEPGGEVVVTLYWEALLPIPVNKQVFVHLYDGYMWAQHDGAPECGINPTTRWEPGQIIADPHIISLPVDLSVNNVPLLVGMYDLISDDRLIVSENGKDFIYLTDVEFQ